MALKVKCPHCGEMIEVELGERQTFRTRIITKNQDLCLGTGYQPIKSLENSKPPKSGTGVCQK